ncbi:DUF459 domain-containing protein [Sutcliffiella deserti]|uniref:DUF459 domain-containing protein n=1 Tax=Sutcliffiella deserti TaxID=2875501 RepID=UPI001CBC7D8C|nr:GDSL-type esterase/lipase family protein [Sutcliffiella deserti]
MKKIIISVIASTVLVVIGLYSVNWVQSNKISSVQTERIIALGDSLTYGIGDQSGNGYVENLEQHLKEKKKTNILVENYGIPGQKTNGLLKQVKQLNIVGSLENVDYFIIFIGTNDLIESNGGDLTELDYAKLADGQDDFEENLNEILTIIRAENNDAPLLFLGLYNPYPNSQKIEEIILEWNERSKTIIANYENSKFIPTNDLFHKKSSDYFSDALHPNKKGYDLLTEKIIEAYDF